MGYGLRYFCLLGLYFHWKCARRISVRFRFVVLPIARDSLHSAFAPHFQFVKISFLWKYLNIQPSSFLQSGYGKHLFKCIIITVFCIDPAWWKNVAYRLSFYLYIIYTTQQTFWEHIFRQNSYYLYKKWHKHNLIFANPE